MPALHTSPNLTIIINKYLVPGISFTTRMEEAGEVGQKKYWRNERTDRIKNKQATWATCLHTHRVIFVIQEVVSVLAWRCLFVI